MMEQFLSFTYIKSFSRMHFSRVRFKIGANRLKNWCCSGLAWVPGPLDLAYSFASSWDSLKPGDN